MHVVASLSSIIYADVVERILSIVCHVHCHSRPILALPSIIEHKVCIRETVHAQCPLAMCNSEIGACPNIAT